MPKYPVKIEKTKVRMYSIPENADERDFEIQKNIPFYAEYFTVRNRYLETVKYLNSTSDAKDADGRQVGVGKAENGGPKAMDLEDIEILHHNSIELLKRASVLRNTICNPTTGLLTKGNDEMQAALKDIDVASLVGELNHYISQTSKELSNLGMIDPSNIPSYQTMSRQSTDIVIDTGDQKLDIVKNQMSSRLPLRFVDENGKLQQGFFTKDVTLEDCTKDVIEKQSELHPEFASFLKQFKEKADYKTCGAILIPEVLGADGKNQRITDEEEIKQKIKNNLTNLYKEKAEEILQTVPFESPNFMKDLIEIDTDLKAEIGRYRTNLDVGIPKGNNLNCRNEAMTSIASMMGLSPLVAHSRSMTIIENGQEIHGTFMANAHGVDRHNAEPESALFDGKDIQIDYPSVVESAVQLQALDYICLNADRHSGNHFYQFKKDQAGNPVLTGFQGIDNDMSFGTTVPNLNQSCKTMPPLSTIKYMSKATADRIKGIRPEALEVVLTEKGLNEVEVQACLKRLQNIKDYIEPASKDYISRKHESYNPATFVPKSQNLTIVDEYTEEHFKEMGKVVGPFRNPIQNCKSFIAEYNKKLMDYNGKLFAKEYNYIDAQLKNHLDKHPELKNNTEAINKLKDEFSEQFKKEEKISRANVEKEKEINKGIKSLHNAVRLDANMTFDMQKKNLDRLVGKLWKPDVLGRQDIPEYKEMYDSLHKLKSEMQKLSDGCVNKETGKRRFLNDKEENYLAELYGSVQKINNKYALAIQKSASRNDAKRVNIAYSINDICNLGIKQRENRVNDINDSMRNAAKQLYEADKRMEKVKDDPLTMERKLAEMQYNATKILSGYLGNLDKLDKDKLAEVRKCYADLTVVRRLDSLKLKEPDKFKTIEEAFAKDSNIVEAYSNKLGKDSDFRKLTDNINPAIALSNNVTRTITAQAEKHKIFTKGDLAITNPEPAPVMGAPV